MIEQTWIDETRKLCEEAHEVGIYDFRSPSLDEICIFYERARLRLPIALNEIELQQRDLIKWQEAYARLNRENEELECRLISLEK